MKNKLLKIVLLMVLLAVSACGDSSSMTDKEKAIIDKRIESGEKALTTKEMKIFEKAISQKPQAKEYCQKAYWQHSMRDFKGTTLTENPDNSLLP